jgi:hypothetical protein
MGDSGFEVVYVFSVIAGLDPAIHPFQKTPVKRDGCAGQARA